MSRQWEMVVKLSLDGAFDPDTSEQDVREVMKMEGLWGMITGYCGPGGVELLELRLSDLNCDEPG